MIIVKCLGLLEGNIKYSMVVVPKLSENTTYVYNDLISVQCNSGFYLDDGVRNNAIQCVEKGIWNLKHSCNPGKFCFACFLWISFQFIPLQLLKRTLW